MGELTYSCKQVLYTLCVKHQEHKKDMLWTDLELVPKLYVMYTCDPQ